MLLVVLRQGESFGSFFGQFPPSTEDSNHLKTIYILQDIHITDFTVVLQNQNIANKGEVLVAVQFEINPYNRGEGNHVFASSSVIEYMQVNKQESCVGL